MRDSHRGVIAASIRPVVETLEDRRMLSASLVHGALKVVGTAGDDTITISADTTRITVNDGAATKRFTKTQVKTISILGGGGADTITINSGIKAQITIKAGEGNDTVNGGSGREIIFGQGGDDSLLGNSGSDQIQAGDGNDHVDGGAGGDFLYGDAGDDIITGGTGNDVLGGDFEDILVFKGAPPLTAGNDNLDGGDGNDWLLGERRVLSMQPYELAQDGQDTFTGGAGNDVLDIGGDGDNITDEVAGDFVPANEAMHFGGDNALHTHAILKLKIKSGSNYKNALVQPNIGFFTTFLGALHTHDLSGLIHYEAAFGSGSYSLIDFFRNAGISMDKNHVGRFLPPAGKKVTMVVTRGATSTFANGKWTTRGGTTFSTTKFGSFVPTGDAATGQPGSPSTHGDVIEIRVG